MFTITHPVTSSMWSVLIPSTSEPTLQVYVHTELSFAHVTFKYSNKNSIKTKNLHQLCHQKISHLSLHTFASLRKKFRPTISIPRFLLETSMPQSKIYTICKHCDNIIHNQYLVSILLDNLYVTYFKIKIGKQFI